MVPIELGKNYLLSPVVPELSQLLLLTSLILIRNEMMGMVTYVLGDLMNL